MNDAGLARMGILQSIADLPDAMNPLFQRRRRPGQHDVQASSGEIFHDQVGHAAEFSQVVYRDNVLMAQFRRELSLPVEALQQIAVLLARVGHHFDRNKSVQRGINRLVHDPHSAAANDVYHIVLVDLLWRRCSHGAVWSGDHRFEAAFGLQVTAKTAGTRLFPGRDTYAWSHIPTRLRQILSVAILIFVLALATGGFFLWQDPNCYRTVIARPLAPQRRSSICMPAS